MWTAGRWQSRQTVVLVTLHFWGVRGYASYSARAPKHFMESLNWADCPLSLSYGVCPDGLGQSPLTLAMPAQKTFATLPFFFNKMNALYFYIADIIILRVSRGRERSYSSVKKAWTWNSDWATNKLIALPDCKRKKNDRTIIIFISPCVCGD